MPPGAADGAAGVALLLGTLSPLAVVAVLFRVLSARFIRAEEAMLEDAFGDACRDYKRRVRRWL